MTNVKPEDMNKSDKMEKVVEQVALTTTKTFRPRRVLPRRKKGMQLKEVEELNQEAHPYYAPQNPQPVIENQNIPVDENLTSSEPISSKRISEQKS